MRSAVYARKSVLKKADRATKQIDDKSASVAIQVENARTFIGQKGWVLDEAHIFIDDGRSGANFHRPGLTAALASLDEFDVLVAADRSRIGRDQIETSNVIRDITDAGVIIISYDSSVGVIAEPDAKPVDLFLGQAQDFASAELRYAAKRRTREGQVKRVKEGRHAGAKIFGYRSKKLLSEDGSTVVATVLESESEEARIIRGVFRMVADGHSDKTIAGTLSGYPEQAGLLAKYFDNRSCLSPTGQKHFAPATIRTWRLNPRYNGQFLWGAKENFERGGKTHLRRDQQDASKIIEGTCPKIVDDDLWARVQAQNKRKQERYARWTKGRFVGSPTHGNKSLYALSGLVTCGVCGNALVGTYSAAGPATKKYRKYGCRLRLRSGKQACTNGLRLDKATLERHVVGLVRAQLTPEHVEAAIKAAIEEYRRRRRQKPDEVGRLKREISKLERQTENLAEAIADGGDAKTLTAALRHKEQALEAKRDLLAKLQGAEVASFDSARLRRELAQNLEHWHKLLATKHAQQLRQVLVQVTDGRLTLVPHTDGGWHIEGRTALGKVLDGPCAPKWCRERDLNSHSVARTGF